MKKRLHKTGIYKADHTKFGGLIYPSDFYTDHRGKDYMNHSPLATRIANDARFDYQCKRYRLNQENNRENRKGD